MKGLENNTYLILYIISNIVALTMLLAAWKQHRILRLMFFLLFAWASWTNWMEAIKAPQFYLDYADLSLLGVYSNFIRGWFSDHIILTVGFIATCQALIAISMLMKGWVFKMGAMGAIIFLLAIMPLGVGSAFPCTLIMAIAMWALFREKQTNYLWVAQPASYTWPTKDKLNLR
ncbi:MAG: hypothetical protein ACHQF0_10485 [Chitinophagales bacterium]